MTRIREEEEVQLMDCSLLSLHVCALFNKRQCSLWTVVFYGYMFVPCLTNVSAAYGL